MFWPCLVLLFGPFCRPWCWNETLNSPEKRHSPRFFGSHIYENKPFQRISYPKSKDFSKRFQTSISMWFQPSRRAAIASNQSEGSTNKHDELRLTPMVSHIAQALRTCRPNDGKRCHDFCFSIPNECEKSSSHENLRVRIPPRNKGNKALLRDYSPPFSLIFSPYYLLRVLFNLISGGGGAIQVRP